MSVPMRVFEPGDNHMGLDVVVPAATLVRGMRAAAYFVDKKDESNSFSCVRLTPWGDRLIISAANPLSMFLTTTQLVEAAFNDAGVVDVPAWMVSQIVSIFQTKSIDSQIRITTHQDSDKVRFSESTGLFDVNVHQWPRVVMEQTAPDVPPIIDDVMSMEPLTSRPQVISPAIAHAVLQATKVMGTEFVLDQADNHYRWRIGPFATAISVVPSHVDDTDEEVEEHANTSGNVEQLRVVRAKPAGGAV